MFQFSRGPQTESDLSNVMTAVESPTAPAVTTGGTINTAGLGSSRVSPAGAVTGVILQPGTVPEQEVWVINEAVAANTITFAAAVTSNVADGAGSALAGLVARKFVWDSIQLLWFRAG